jgi:hypothetical protein
LAALRPGNTLRKNNNLPILPLFARIVVRRSRSSRASLCNLAQVEPVKAAIMNRQRLVTVATALTVVIAGCAIVWLAGFGSAGTDHADGTHTGGSPVLDHPAPSLTADVGPVTTTHTTTAQDRPAPIVEAAPADAPLTPPPEASAAQVATANPSDTLPDAAGKAVGSIEIPDGCEDADVCIDHYLWALYQRTPKEDSIKVEERRKVAVKKKRKTVMVVRTFTRLVDEDFTWKDVKAAEKTGMPMPDYVIGGMDRHFKLKLFRSLRAADEAGLYPGITSAFRDDYRQSLASGLKAATSRSYHGGSFRGGYGHGLAADIVSIKGETRDERYHSSESLWKWIDAHGGEFGIGRPYLDRDPPHVAPIDGTEYAAHHRPPETRHAASKKRSRLVARANHSVAKRSKTVRSSRQRTT